MRLSVRVPLLWLVPLLAGLLLTGCKKEEHPLVETLRQTWELADPAGEVQLVAFDELEVRWKVGTDDEYSGDYRLASVNNDEGRLHIRMKCEKRTGSDDWIEYVLDFNADRTEFQMAHSDGVLDGIFRRHDHQH